MRQRAAAVSALFLALTLTLACTGRRDAVPAPAAPAAAAPTPAPVAERLEIPIRNARMLPGGVLSGGQPTREQLEQAAAAGYRTVVNLRTPGEEGAWDEAPLAAELGLRYVVIPVAGAEGLTVDNVRALAEIVDDPEARPLMVHCASGNRVGALLALKAYQLDGESAEAALEIGLAAGLTRLEGAVREQLGLAD